MKTLANLSAALVAAAAAAGAAAAEEASSDGTRTVKLAPGAHYQAGWFRRLFLGDHWREAWSTPLQVPVLDLDSFDGGLTPDREGGGLETFNLHFKSKNGRTWVFRSLDKNPRRNLDPETAQGWIGDLTQDMISAAHPCAPLMIAPFLQAAGVLHATPSLVALPEDDRLAEFRQNFTGMLGTFEERVEWRVPGVDKVEDSLALFARLDRHKDESVDARDYLRSRLVDLLVGDWDRHLGQYRWVRIGKVWRVVPRDRDEAFSRFDGALPSILEYYGKPLVGWGTTYPPIDKITFAARFTDRRYLVPLERADFEAVTAEVSKSITDEVIAQAVHGLPAPLYAEGGEDLERALRSRRDLLAAASRDYYRLLAREVDVRGTTGADEFQIERRPDGSLAVLIFARDEESGERAAAPYFRRTFVPDETSEVRLYTLGGRDRVVEQGNGSGAILLRIVSPPGTSEFVDRSADQSATRLYQAKEPPRLSPEELKAKLSKDARYEERIRYEVARDWGRDYLFFPQLSYDSTRGLLFGTFLQRTGYGFALEPFASQMELGAAWATRLNRPRLEYGGDFRTRSPIRGLVYLAYSGVEQAKFFGFGNETARVSALDSRGFYDARQDQMVVNPMLEVSLLGGLRARAGAEFKHVWSVDRSGLIGQIRPSGADGMSVGSAEGGLGFSASSGAFPLQRTIAANVRGSVAPAAFSNPATFGKLRGSVSALYGAHLLTNLQLSARVSGQRNFGNYPFFESAFLGGTAGRSVLDVTGSSFGNLLRGYDLNRFAGDAAVATNTELNVELGKYSAFLPLRYGVFGLFDSGRVFLDSERSSRWHYGAGGGVWLGLFAGSPFFQLAGSIKAALVRSDEGTSFYLASGFGL